MSQNPPGNPGDAQPNDGEDAQTPAHSEHGAHAAGDRNGALRSGAKSWLKEIATIVVIAIVLSFLIKTFLFRAFFIPSGSMENTLEINDRIFVNQLVPKPFGLQRGDVVVFKDTQGWLAPQPATNNGPFGWVDDALVFIGLMPDSSQQYLVKRVIGLPGDHVVCCNADGKITVNGVALTEPYLYPGAAPSDIPFNVVVPAGELWVMGDHRNDSADSRYHQDQPGKGFVPISDVDGRAMVIAWPLTRWAVLGNYPQVFGDVPKPATPAPSAPSLAPAAK